MAIAFTDMTPEQKKFVAICEWFAQMEHVDDLEWLVLTGSEERFDAWARQMFDKYNNQLTDIFVTELVLLRYFTGD